MIIFLNMTEQCLGKLFWLWQGCEYAWLRIDRVLNIPQVLNASARNMARLWIFKGYTGCWIYLNAPEHTLEIPQYAWICRNNTGYALIYLNTQSSESAKILNFSDAVHNIRSLYKLLSSDRGRGVFNYCQTFKKKSFAKRIIQGQQPDFSRRGKVSWN